MVLGPIGLLAQRLVEVVFVLDPGLVSRKTISTPTFAMDRVKIGNNATWKSAKAHLANGHIGLDVLQPVVVESIDEQGNALVLDIVVD